jgi:UDP-N-acetylmuramate dehydrogenase
LQKKNNLQIHIIGGGSNILISDQGVSGLVISTIKFNKVEIHGKSIVVDSGITLKKVNKKISKASLTGMEFSSGLPGTIGGAVYMNARAYGKQFSDIIVNVKAINNEGKILEFKNDKLKYSYKKSMFMNVKDLIIIKAELKLEKGNHREIVRLYKKNYKDRVIKKQYKHPCAGCVFKNDASKDIIAGKIIDELGLKKIRIGGAEISEHHGNFIINKRKAKADDVIKLIELIEKKVYEKKQINLEREIVFLGF